MTGGQVFALHVGLGVVPASLEDVLGEIGGRLDHLQPRLTWEDAGLRLTLTVAAGDLWLAVLLAMAAVTGTGYPVVRLDAGPSEPLPEVGVGVGARA